MVPITPQDEPWDQEMEVFSDGASSGEVSVVVSRVWSHLPPSLWPGLERETAWGWGAKRPGKPPGGCGAVEKAGGDDRAVFGWGVSACLADYAGVVNKFLHFATWSAIEGRSTCRARLLALLWDSCELQVAVYSCVL